VGSDAGAWCPYGEITDFPPDQRAEDGLALTYTSGALSDSVEVLGHPEVTLLLEVDRPWALAAVRLCDVAPDGRSLLVARGLLNLSHRESHLSVEPMPIGEPTEVRVVLDLTGHVFAPGHRIRIAVSAGYWPFAWPSPEPVALTLLLGDKTRLELPVRAAGPYVEVAFAEPETSTPAAGRVEHSARRTVRRDVADEEFVIETGDEERSSLAEARLEFGERVSRRYTLRGDCPLSARVDCEGVHYLRRDGWKTEVRLRTSMSATAESFRVTKWLEAREGDVRVYRDETEVEIPRDGV
jgi:hypothetical protein